jgi:hypothetical protein
MPTPAERYLQYAVHPPWRQAWWAKSLGYLCAGVLLVSPGCSTDAGRPANSASGPAASQNAEGGRSALLQKPFDRVAELAMLQIGRAYEISLAAGAPPKDKLDLGAQLTTTRDLKKREVEVVYGVNPQKLPNGGAGHMLAWEKESTQDGHRMVLMADCRTVKYLSEEEFKNTPKAK